MKRLRDCWFCRPRLIYFTLVCTLLTVVINLWTPFLVRDIIDRMVDGTATPAFVLRLSLIFLVASLLAALGSRGMRGIPTALIFHVMHDIRAAAMVSLARLDPSFYRGTHTGDIMNRMNSDARAVGEMVGYGLMNGLRATLAFSIALIIMFRQDYRLAWLILVLIPSISAIIFVLVLVLRKRYDAAQEQLDRISSFSQENFLGVRVIKGFGIEKRQSGIFADMNKEYIRRNLAFNQIEAPIWPLITFFFAAANVLLLWIGGRLVMRGELTLGTLVQFLQYLTFLQWPVLSVGWTLGMFMRGLASWKRMETLLHAEPRVDNRLADTAAQPMELSGDIVFDHVTLMSGENKILDDLSLTLPAGRMIGLTGPTGCGKTTLASLLLRLADPDAGRITASGRDLRTFPLSMLRSSIRTAPQEPFLFSNSIAHNLTMGQPDLSSDSLHSAAWVAAIDQEIQTFPEGYKTVVGERGMTLSGGQRQRVSIARAILGEAHILILDDTLSAVDTHTEQSVLDRLLPVLQGKTVLLISHRVSTLRYVDQIVVMGGGKIAQQGTHEELVARPGYYRELDTAQRLQAQLEEFA